MKFVANKFYSSKLKRNAVFVKNPPKSFFIYNASKFWAAATWSTRTSSPVIEYGSLVEDDDFTHGDAIAVKEGLYLRRDSQEMGVERDAFIGWDCMKLDFIDAENKLFHLTTEGKCYLSVALHAGSIVWDNRGTYDQWLNLLTVVQLL